MFFFSNIIGEGTTVVADKQPAIAEDDIQGKNTLPAPVPLSIKSGQTTLSYKEAKEFYMNAHLQFGPDCTVVKGSSNSFVQGNQIMVDNRDSNAILVTIGAAKFAVGPYDFSFVTLTEKGSIPADCNNKKNVTVLQVQ